MTKREDDLKQSLEERQQRRMGRKIHAVRKTEPKQSEVGRNQSKKHHRCKERTCFKKMICIAYVLVSPAA